MRLEIEFVREIHRVVEYLVKFEENGKVITTTVTVVGDTTNYSNDQLPELVMDFVDDYLRD